MKKVLIGVHGLGNKPPKYLLNKWWKEAMNEGFKENGIKNELPEFELIYWADLLYDKPLNKWEKNTESPYFIDEPYLKSPKNYIAEDNSVRLKVVDFVSSQLNKLFLKEDKTLNYGFISDFILQNFFKDLEVYYIEDCEDEFDITCKARDLIRKRISQVLRKYEDYEIMIISHSMGSIITFDVLTFLIPELKINTLITIGSPLGLPLVVSKIASEHKKRQNGQKYMATPPGIIKSWFNLADIRDEVALNYKLNDDFTSNEMGIAPIDFLVDNNYVTGEKSNPHKSFGYLRTPEMSKILGEFMIYERKNLIEKAIDKLGGFLGKIKEQGELVKDRLNIN
jgi:hypothetical protein